MKLIITVLSLFFAMILLVLGYKTEQSNACPVYGEGHLVIFVILDHFQQGSFS